MTILNDDATPAARVMLRLLALLDPMPGASDDEIARRCDAIADAVESLSRLPACTWSDVDAKLAVLAHNLRRQVSVGDADAILNVLLAEAVRDDVRRLARLAIAVTPRLDIGSGADRPPR